MKRYVTPILSTVAVVTWTAIICDSFESGSESFDELVDASDNDKWI